MYFPGDRGSPLEPPIGARRPSCGIEPALRAFFASGFLIQMPIAAQRFVYLPGPAGATTPVRESQFAKVDATVYVVHVNTDMIEVVREP